MTLTYECILLDIPSIEDFGKSYGMDGRKKLVRRIAEEIRNCFGTRAVIGRMGVNRFIILQNREEEGMIEKELDDLSGKSRPSTVWTAVPAPSSSARSGWIARKWRMWMK